MVSHLIMETGAEVGAVHPAVAGQEAAALAEGETVDLVVTEELGLAGGDQGRHQGGRGLVVVGAGELPQVGHQAVPAQGPLEAAVAQQRVARQEEHLARSCPGGELGNFNSDFYYFSLSSVSSVNIKIPPIFSTTTISPLISFQWSQPWKSLEILVFYHFF